MRWSYASLLLFLVVAASALFEDQVGKFDWRHQFVGCPTQIALEQSRSGKRDTLLLTSKEQAVASISLNSGAIVWRRLQERNATGDIVFATTELLFITVADSGREVRAWDKRKGGLKWNVWLADLKQDKVQIAATPNFAVVLAGNTVYGIDEAEPTLRWKATIHRSDWSAIVTIKGRSSSASALAREDIVLVTGIDRQTVTVTPLDFSGLATDGTVWVKAEWFAKDGCAISGGALWCASATGQVTGLDLGDRSGAPVSVAGKTTGRLLPLEVPFTVAVRSDATTVVYALRDGKISATASITGTVRAVGGVELRDEERNGHGAVVVALEGGEIEVYELREGKRVAKASLPPSLGGPRLSLVRLALAAPSAAAPHDWQAVGVADDCRIVSLVVDGRKQADAFVEWTREEALARVSKVEMLDLPLSELQASIEDEFEGGGRLGVVGAFIRRLTTQAQQLQKWTAQQIAAVSSLLATKGGTLDEIMKAIRNQGGAKASGMRGQPFERDFFNMRKLIVATTLEGVVYGIDNADGGIRWRLRVDEAGRFAPLESQLGERVVPLFVQRTAIHPGLPAVASVVYRDIGTHETVIVTFDAMSGAVASRRRLPPAKRIEMLPREADDHLHPMVIFLKNGQVVFEPESARISASEKQPPLHLMDVDPETGSLVGYAVSLKADGARVHKRWTGELGLEKGERIVAVQGKPANQRVHSRGRVLIDRNVHYKYINPNLVVVVALDELKQTLSLSLVDAVSGQIVYSGRASKVTGPVHVVHCEHWVAYTYWSERSRRTELSILELYEGQDQPDSNVFDSLIPTRHQPQVVAQSYIFSQGVEAMGVSETEQGATTRSLIMALPFGGLFEVTRRFVDATRPTELTQEMREEMMIPYIPEIPIATEDMVNYHQSVFNIREIKSFPSGLESTSLMLAWGTDMFYTRVTPSGTFDILKDDYDTGLISMVLIGLFVVSYVCKKLVRRNSIKTAWS